MSEESTVEAAPVESTDVENTDVPEVTEEVKDTPSQEDLFASRFSALSKREKKLVDERTKYKEYQAKVEAMDAIKEGGVAKALEYHGFSIDDVIEFALGQEVEKEVDPVDKVRQDFEQYKQSQEDKVEAERKAQEEENQNSIEKAITAHKQSIDSHLSQHPDKYELITSQGEQELVWNVTEAHFEEYGEVLSVEAASDKVEEYLENKVKELLKLNKFSQRDVQDKQEQKAAPTLSSKYNSSTIPVQEKILSREDSLKQAASLLKWK